jgi:hypothetical protein
MMMMIKMGFLVSAVAVLGFSVLENPTTAAFQISTAGATQRASTVLSVYVPDGFTPESYKKFKEQEAAKKKKNLGRLGPKGFQSRSMQSFQEALERGEASHLMPVFNSREKITRGEIRAEDVPVSFVTAI